MYSYRWFANKASGVECVETLEEATERFALDRLIHGAFYFEVRLRSTNELVLEGR